MLNSTMMESSIVFSVEVGVAVNFPGIELQELKEDMCRFILSDTDTSVANALRRVMIAEVPTMAIDLVTLYDNSSSLQDEFLAHRLGLIPLRVEEGVMFEYNYDCDCEDHCDKCAVEFRLNVSFEQKAAECPPGEEPVVVHVTSKDLQSSHRGVQPVHFTPSDAQDFCQDTGIVIAKLSRGQRISLIGIAKKGVAKEHAKWSPVCVATYQFDPEVEVDTDVAAQLTPEQRDSIVKCCPTSVYELNEYTGALQVKDRTACMYCDECSYLADSLKARAEDDPVVKVRPSNDRFLFTVETNGSLTAEEVVTRSLEVLRGKLQTLRNELVAVKQDEGGL